MDITEIKLNNEEEAMNELSERMFLNFKYDVNDTSPGNWDYFCSAVGESKKENSLKIIFYYDKSDKSLMEQFQFQFENNTKKVYTKEGKTLEVEYIKKKTIRKNDKIFNKSLKNKKY